MYGANDNTKAYRPAISSEDIIIGTTAMMLGAHVLTCDCNDFPRPFFKEVNKRVLFYEEKGRQKHIIIYLLVPDANVIKATYASLDPDNRI